MATMRLGKVVATINGLNTANIEAGNGISISQNDDTITINANIESSLDTTLNDAKSYTDQQIASALNVGSVYVINASIESSDWVEDENGFYFDVEDEYITDEMMPIITLSTESLAIAYQAGMYQTAETFNGYLRVRSVERASGTISMNCGLYVQGSAMGSSYVLPIATADTLGGVKIGNGVNISSDGTITVDSSTIANEVNNNYGDEIANNIATNYSEQIVNAAIASDQENQDMIDDVYGDDNNN